jgi:hypothetical protein
MALDEARRASLLAYCRIDALEEGEAELLETLYHAAVSYLEQAGVSEPMEGTPRRAQYDLLINALVLDSYDRRDVSASTGGSQENPAFRRSLNQLKMTEPDVSESDTTAAVSESDTGTDS